ncbi:L-2-amino-thiazoline-4-carboxylic acid hydrolase [Candidatus Bathyarchaeota archaeon]|nr:L-2-amino-thiazoline-4-carboxylic acid hydrolase [Candidatus Bathyarchaeota archaeon]
MEGYYTREEVAEQVRRLGRMFGLLFYHFSKVIIEELGEERGRELIREVIRRFGLERGQRMRERALSMGLEPTLENFHKVSDLPEVGWGGAPREHFCPFAEVWFEKDAIELGKLYCDVDIWKYKGYNPHIEVERKRWILEGDDECKYELRMRGE